MIRYILLIAITCFPMLANAQKVIALSCFMTGTESISSTKSAVKKKPVTGTVTYLFKEEPRGWTVQVDGESSIRTQADLEGVKSNDSELYYSAYVDIDEYKMSVEWTRRIPSFVDDKGERQPLLWWFDKTTINRLSGQISRSITIDVKGTGDFKGKTVRDLSGTCTPATKKF